VVLDRGSTPVGVVVDERADMPGRGAWLHRDPECVGRAISRKAFARALRHPGAVDTGGLAGLEATADHTMTNPSKAGGKNHGHAMSALR
jgi:predicted RNA-binding protein YlxR (DUF448 family)